MGYRSPDAVKSLFELELLTSFLDETFHGVELNSFTRLEAFRVM
jgi:hypothetical protein